MTRTILVSGWGKGAQRHNLGSFTVRRREEDYSDAEAVARSVARRTGLSVCTCRWDGTALSNGRPESNHYQMTLGRPVSRRLGGGYSVDSELWVAIPVPEEV